VWYNLKQTWIPIFWETFSKSNKKSIHIYYLSNILCFYISSIIPKKHCTTELFHHHSYLINLPLITLLTIDFKFTTIKFPVCLEINSYTSSLVYIIIHTFQKTTIYTSTLKHLNITLTTILKKNLQKYKIINIITLSVLLIINSRW